jgi:hypothetical protein
MDGEGITAPQRLLQAAISGQGLLHLLGQGLHRTDSAEGASRGIACWKDERPTLVTLPIPQYIVWPMMLHIFKIAKPPALSLHLSYLL